MKRKWTIAAAILLIFCLMAAPAYAKAKTEKNISGELQTKTLSKKTVKLKWEKHKVDKYTIYKVVYDKNGNSKEKKLKTVSGKKTSVVIKAGKNAYLSLHIKGVKKSSNTVYNGFTTCWTGLATPEFEITLLAVFHHTGHSGRRRDEAIRLPDLPEGEGRQEIQADQDRQEE